MTESQEALLAVQKSVEEISQELRDLRSRELQKSKGLKKGEMCPLCGNADRPGLCRCLAKRESEQKQKGDCPDCKKNVTIKDGKIGFHFHDRGAPCSGRGQSAMDKGDTDMADTKLACSTCKAENCTTHKATPMRKSLSLADLRKDSVAFDALTGKGKFAQPSARPAAAKLPGVPAKNPAVPVTSPAPAPAAAGGVHPESAKALADVKAIGSDPIHQINTQLKGFKSLASNPTSGLGGGTLVNPKASGIPLPTAAPKGVGFLRNLKAKMNPAGK